MTKKSRQKFKYLENKKSFEDEINSIFHHFKGLLVMQIKSNIKIFFKSWFYYIQIIILEKMSLFCEIQS